MSPSFSGDATDTYTLLTAGPFAQYGTWRVLSMDNAGAGFAVAAFLVRPENVASADLSLLKFGPLQAFAGGSMTYSIQITNRGPDAAQNVSLSEPVPNNTTFISEQQSSGPTATCTNPSVGGTGTSTCTIASLDVGESASFTFVYDVEFGTPVETIISNTATVTATNELFPGDNLANYQTAIVGVPPPPQCTVNCPADVSVDNDANQCSAVVSYASPTTSGNCVDAETGQTAVALCSPASGSVFPVGATTVTCTVAADSCSFTVTVHDTRPPVQPTITCPSDVVVDRRVPGGRRRHSELRAGFGHWELRDDSMRACVGLRVPIG